MSDPSRYGPCQPYFLRARRGSRRTLRFLVLLLAQSENQNLKTQRSQRKSMEIAEKNWFAPMVTCFLVSRFDVKLHRTHGLCERHSTCVTSVVLQLLDHA